MKISFSTNSTKKKEMEFCIIIFLIEFRRGGGLSGQVSVNGQIDEEEEEEEEEQETGERREKRGRRR